MTNFDFAFIEMLFFRLIVFGSFIFIQGHPNLRAFLFELCDHFMEYCYWIFQSYQKNCYCWMTISLFCYELKQCYPFYIFYLNFFSLLKVFSPFLSPIILPLILHIQLFCQFLILILLYYWVLCLIWPFLFFNFKDLLKFIYVSHGNVSSVSIHCYFPFEEQ